MRRFTFLLSVTLLVASSANAPHARAADKEACAAAAERAQDFRGAGKLASALPSLVTCAQGGCPAVVRTYCESWLSEVRAVVPTIVVRATKGGRDIALSAVLLDGTPLAGATDGRAVAVDPGRHVFRFEHASGASLEQEHVVVEGQKNRVIEAQFPADIEAPRAPDLPVPRTSSRPPAAAWVAGGIGIAALGGFSVLAVTGQNEFERCQRDGGCSASDVDSLATRRGFAWALGGVGVVSLVIGAVLIGTSMSTSSGRQSQGGSPASSFK